MKNIRLLLVLFSMLLVGTLAACNNTDHLAVAREELIEQYADTIGSTTYEVTANLDLVETAGEATVTWTSSNTSVISNTGVVTRPQANATVSLTATISYGDKTDTLVFTVTVKKVDVTDQDKVNAAKTLLETEYADTIGDVDFEVTEDLTLVTTIGEATVTWATTDATIISASGEVTRPSYVIGDQTITLTATLTVGTATTTKAFYAYVLANVKTVSDTLNEVLDVVTSFPDVEGITGAEDWIDFLTTYTHETVAYTITWTSSNAAVLDVDGTVTRPAMGEANVDVVMTASITSGDVTVTRTVDFTVYAYTQSTVLSSIEAVYEVEPGTYVKFEGVTVIGKMSGGFFVYDGTSVIYIYDTKTLYNNVEVGSVYDIEGVFAYYFNAPQLANDEEQPLTAVASSLPAQSLDGAPAVVSDFNDKPTPSGTTPMVYEYVSLNAKVMVDESDTASGSNYHTYFVPVDFTGEKVVKTVVEGFAKTYETDAMILYYQSKNLESVKALDGKIVTINVLVYGWRTDRSIWYSVYFGDGTDIDVVFDTDTEAVAAAKAILPTQMPSLITETTTLNLPTEVYGATVVWSSSSDALINPTTGVVTPVSGSQTTVTLTATITKGDPVVTDTVTISVKVGEIPLSTVETIVAATAGDTVYRVQGIVTANDYSERTYFIQQGDSGIAIYTSNEALMATLKANVGKVVEVIGKRAEYKGLRQISPSEITAVGEGTLPTAVNIDAHNFDAVALLPFQGRLVEMTNLFVKTRSSDSYGNVTVTFTNGTADIVMKFSSYTEDLTQAAKDRLALLVEGSKWNVVNPLAWDNFKPFLYFTETTELESVALSDLDKAQMDSNEVVTEFTLTEAGALALTANGTNGSTVTYTFKNAEDVNNALVDLTAKTVTMPTSGQVVVTLVAKVQLNEAFVEIDVLVSLGTPEGGLEGVLYTSGFESPDFAAATVYNNTTEALFGPSAQQWAIVSGTVSTTSAISGSQSMQTRDYSSMTVVPTMTTKFTLSNVTKVEFYAANTNDVKVTVSYSLDGTNWIGESSFNLTTTSTMYTYTLNAGEPVVGNVYIRFSADNNGTENDKERLYVDDVTIYGLLAE